MEIITLRNMKMVFIVFHHFKHLILIKVQSVGSVDKTELSIDIKPDNELSKGYIELIRDKVI